MLTPKQLKDLCAPKTASVSVYGTEEVDKVGEAIQSNTMVRRVRLVLDMPCVPSRSTTAWRIYCRDSPAIECLTLCAYGRAKCEMASRLLASLAANSNCSSELSVRLNSFDSLAPILEGLMTLLICQKKLSSLELVNTRIEDDLSVHQRTVLAEALSQAEHLSEMKFVHRADGKTVLLFLEGLRDSSSLQTVIVDEYDGTTYDSETTEALGRHLGTLTGLETLEFRNVDFSMSRKDFRRFTRGMVAASRLKNLTITGDSDINMTSLDDGHAIVLAGWLMASTSLETLDISETNLSVESFAMLCGALATNRSLTSLDVSDNGIAGPTVPEILEDLFHSNQTLKQLHLEAKGLEYCTAETWACMAASSGLTHLNTDDNGELDNWGATEVFEGCREKCDILAWSVRGELNSDEVEETTLEMRQRTTGHVRSFTLTYTFENTREYTTFLGQQLRDPTCCLESLTLSPDHFLENEQDVQDAQASEGALHWDIPQCATLRHLVVGEYDFDDWQRVFQAVGNTSQLERLTLTWPTRVRGAEDDFYASLRATLQEHKKLVQVEIRGEGFDHQRLPVCYYTARNRLPSLEKAPAALWPLILQEWRDPSARLLVLQQHVKTLIPERRKRKATSPTVPTDPN